MKVAAQVSLVKASMKVPMKASMGISLVKTPMKVPLANEGFNESSNEGLTGQ